MLKPGKTFNLNKQAKRFMATIVDAEQRNAFKRMAIQAQLYSEIAPPKREKRPEGRGTSGTTTSSGWTQNPAAE